MAGPPTCQLTCRYASSRASPAVFASVVGSTIKWSALARRRVRQRAPERVRPEDHVGIGEEQPIRIVRRDGMRCRNRHGVRLAQPAGRKARNVDRLEPRAMGLGQRIHDRPGLVGGTIVYADNPHILVVLPDQRFQARGNTRRLIPRRHHDHDRRAALRCGVIRVRQQVGQAAQASRGLNQLAEPRQRDQPGESAGQAQEMHQR